ncbi:phosphoribosyltransferase family protein [Nakamurella deserti]|uniref:phosphoribosyltransferase family protein n=1 Tax=Nakamurella deserti TaxID=2164074 RepID=UPI000DBE7554|nr:phosphoribosyltransferase family protein [Nakamurella deserti]
MTAAPPRTDGWVGDRFGVRLHTGGSVVGWELPELVGLALRRNPRRAHLLVSTVLGKHVPVEPGLVRGAGRLLGLLVAASLGELPADRVRTAAEALRRGDHDPVDALVAGHRPATGTAVFGFAETATGLGHCVAEALHARSYLHSTRREVAGVPVALRFEEGHSHATAHLVQPQPAGLLGGGGPDEVLVLVDDELSTGTTAIGAIRALHAVAPRRRYVVAALIDLRSPADAATLDAFADDLGVAITVVALTSGGVHLPAGLAGAAAAHVAAHPAAPSAAAPVPPVTRVVLPWPAALPEGGRHGALGAEAAAFDAAVSAAAEVLDAAVPAGRVLVVGTEELMYLPLRLATALVTPLRTVRFQTTTRSPVHPVDDPGYPVRRAFRFVSPEPDPDGVPRYLYNATWDDGTDPDAVVVVVDAATDTAALSAPDGLFAALAVLGVPLVLAVVPGADPSILGDRP